MKITDSRMMRLCRVDSGTSHIARVVVASILTPDLYDLSKVDD